jgi:Mrp family chromosome partitioning ATPase
MSRIADALEKAREENATPDRPITPSDRPGLLPRSITDVRVPWAVKGTSSLERDPVPAVTAQVTRPEPARTTRPEPAPRTHVEPAQPALTESALANGSARRQSGTASASEAAEQPLAPAAKSVAAPETNRPTPAADSAADPLSSRTAPRGVRRLRDDATDEAVKSVVRELFLDRDGPAIRRVLFTSVDDSPGAADVVIRVAAVFAAQATGPVYLLDMDLHHPGFDRRFDLEGQPGFSDAVMAGGQLRGYAHSASPESNLWVMPAGLQIDNVRSIADQASTHRRIAALIGTHDDVIGYTAAIGHYPDAELIGRLFDGVVLVLQPHTTTAEATRRAANAVKTSQAQLLGTILDKRLRSDPS